MFSYHYIFEDLKKKYRMYNECMFRVLNLQYILVSWLDIRCH